MEPQLVEAINTGLTASKMYTSASVIKSKVGEHEAEISSQVLFDVFENRK